MGNSPSVVLGALCRPEKDRYEQGGKGAPASGKPAPGMGSIHTARESGAPRLSSLSHELSPARSPALTTPRALLPRHSLSINSAPYWPEGPGALLTHRVLELHHNLTLETNKWIPSYLCRTSNMQKGRPCNPNSRVLAAPLLYRPRRSHASLWETSSQRSCVSWETMDTHCDHSRSRSHRVPVSREENLLLCESDGLEF